jgi:hypothetical protein
LEKAVEAAIELVRLAGSSLHEQAFGLLV